MLLNSSLPASFVQPNRVDAENPPTARTDCPAVAVPFAQLPHAIASDARLTPIERLACCALLFHAIGKPTARMSNRALAAYLAVSIPTVERALRKLAALGYVAVELTRATLANPTGRIVRLRWVEDRSVLPPAPSRSSRRPAETPAPPSPVTDPLPQPWGAPPIKGDGGPPSMMMAEGDRPVEKGETSKKAGQGADQKRRRPQAAMAHEPTATPAGPPKARRVPDVSSIDPGPGPLATSLSRALAALRPTTESGGDHRLDQVSAMPPPAPGKPSGLTPGQLALVECLTPEEAGRLDSLSANHRAQILAPHADRFDPALLPMVRSELKARPLIRKPAARPTTTAGLVEAVAGGDAGSMAALAEALVEDFGGPGDRRRWGAVHSLAGQLFRGEVDPADVLDAHGQAMGPRAENRGAVFTVALRRAGWKP